MIQNAESEDIRLRKGLGLGVNSSLRELCKSHEGNITTKITSWKARSSMYFVVCPVATQAVRVEL